MPKKFSVLGVGIRAGETATELLLVQDAGGVWSLPMGVPGATESAPVAVVRLVQEVTGWQGAALAGLMELFAAGLGPPAVALLVIDAVSVQPPAAGLTPAWRSRDQAATDLVTGRSEREASALVGALTRLVARWETAVPPLAP